MDLEKSYNGDIDCIRVKEFPFLQDVTYVDHVGTTLYSKQQIENVQQDLISNLYGNPHSRSPSSCLSTDSIDQIRYRILNHFNTNSEEYSVIFTSGCTGALKLIAESFDFGNDTSDSETSSQGGCFCYLLDNHSSVQGMREIAAERGCSIICLDEDELNKKQLDSSSILLRSSLPCGGNCLFAYPAQSNFSGHKYPLSWLSDVKNGQMGFTKHFPGHWYSVLDAAAYISTSYLDLSIYKPDFVTLSFYKMFGYPTGLGALLVHKDAHHVMKKRYFGGGTLEVSTARERFQVYRKDLSDRFEDGTVSFLDIIALRHGFDILTNLAGGIKKISLHTFSIAQFFHHNLQDLHHGNGCSLAEIYAGDNFCDIQTHGATVNFNLKRANGDYIGFAEVDKLAQSHNIHLRTGCFCNIGACQKFLKLSSEDIKKNFDAGHVCGDQKDLIDGRPTGSVRISFGYMSTMNDAAKCLNFIVESFLEKVSEKPSFNYKMPNLQNQTTSFVGGKVSLPDDFDSERLTGSTGAVEQILKKELHVSLNKKNKILEQCDESNMYLTNIYLYPVKSCAAFEVDEWKIGDRGLMYDRNWMIVTESGVALTQKREPKLCVLKPRISLTTRSLILSYPEMDELIVALEGGSSLPAFDGQVCTTKVCSDRIQGVDCGDMASKWVSKALERPGCRLIRQSFDDKRRSKLKDSVSDNNGDNRDVGLSLSNESQYLLISRSSVAALRNKMIEESMEKLPHYNIEDIPDIENLIERFRGNFVVSGKMAFEEESWTTIIMKENSFVNQGKCNRCRMICLDQNTGERSKLSYKDPFQTLAAWRGGKVPFGIHLRNSEIKNSLKIGDVLHVEKVPSTH